MSETATGSEKEKVIVVMENTFDDDYSKEDGDTAFIGTLSDEKDESDDGIFTRIISVDSAREHSQFKKFVNRKIRVTIETID